MYRIPRKLKKYYRSEGWVLQLSTNTGTIYGRAGHWSGGWIVISRPKGYK
jgi:hypothetical protein